MTNLREIIFDIGGGIPDEKKFKAVQLGGPSGGCVPEAHLDIPIDYEEIAKVGAIMGSGGAIVIRFPPTFAQRFVRWLLRTASTMRIWSRPTAKFGGAGACGPLCDRTLEHNGTRWELVLERPEAAGSTLRGWQFPAVGVLILALAALAAAIAESLDTPLDDNLLVPVVGGGVLWGATLVDVGGQYTNTMTQAGQGSPTKADQRLLGAIDEHSVGPLVHSGAGQSVGYFEEIKPVADIMLAGADGANPSRLIEGNYRILDWR